MFYYNNGRRINIINPGRPINLSSGGLIPRLKGIPDRDMNVDTISAKLEVGSLVVPVKHVKALNGYKGEMTGPATTSPKKLVKAIVLPYEQVVHKKHAPKVEQFLRKKGIRLPNT
jgi:hypothetical protein